MSANREHKQSRFYISILLKLIIPFVISFLTVLILIIVTDILKFRHALQNANLTLLFITVLKVPLIILIMMLKWRQILVDRKYALHWKSLFSGIMIGFFFNNITPGLKIGGEPLKAYYLAQKNSIDFKLVMASIVTEKMLQGVTLIVVTLSAILLGFLSHLPFSSLKPFLFGAIGFTVLIAVLLYISLFKFQWVKSSVIIVFSCLRFIPKFKRSSFDEKVLQVMEDIHQEYSASLSNKHTLTLVIGLSILQAALDFLHPCLIFKALNVSAPMVFIIISATAVKLVSMFGITPGGSGIAEGVNFGFYAFLFSISKEIAAVHTFLSRALDAWLIWILSAIAMFFIRPDLHFRESFLTRR